MLIELEEPYKSVWDRGYLVLGSDNRRRVHFVKDGVTVGGTSYARYLMSVHLGYFVPDDLEVDHKDDDPTNDVLSNFQLLTPEQNRIKQLNRIARERGETEMTGFECAHCGTRFILDDRLLKMRLKISRTGLAFCSQSCSSSMVPPPSAKPKDEETIAKIKDLRSQGLSSYKIAEELDISRNTVMKYWNG